jgi:hypothetical protein
VDRGLDELHRLRFSVDVAERTAQWEPAFLGDPLQPMVISVASTAFEIAASKWTLLRSRTAKIQFSSLARFPCHDFRIATLRAWPRFFSSFRWAIHRIFHSKPPKNRT